ncbi:hypothetical protein QAD02_010343 [Eretmocerus hayati]|uniref:Uncharacterized protein n=1 Tax=Eretmocerus hayati TaxID=131215 RepID=A0ACC2NBY7_9HYME|nr:hypothetical protein QAD02_010343 [Eretmocerus hayati]
MGQAWCKERSVKAQDSKSPLDRVFVRCANTIYPGLKEEGSAFGNITRGATSSEIGFTSLPRKPRTALRRGHSIDSVDRPFHPSDWVDVNLEVPCEPSPPPYLLRFAARQQQHRAQANGRPDQQSRRSSGCTPAMDDQEVSTAQPVPPPRRRRRRHRRSSLGSQVAAEESSTSPITGPTLFTDTSNCNSSEGLCDALVNDSEDEFIEIERSLQKSSSQRQLDCGPPGLHSATRRQKKRSSTSLPGDTAEPSVGRVGNGDATKSASLPRDATGAYPQIHFEETEPWEAESTGPPPYQSSCSHAENLKSSFAVEEISLAEFDEISLGKVEAASTPLKTDHRLQHQRRISTSSPESEPFPRLQDDAEPKNNVSDNDDKNQNQVAAVLIHTAKPASIYCQEGKAMSDDHGSISGVSQSTQPRGDDSTRSDLFHDAAEQLSSAITLGVISRSRDENGVGLQRTISEESLPNEMQIDELGVKANDPYPVSTPDEKIESGTSEICSRRSSDDTNASDSFNTPPPSPEPKTQVVSTLSNGLAKSETSPEMNRRSTSPNPIQLKAALNDICASDSRIEPSQSSDVDSTEQVDKLRSSDSTRRTSKLPRPSPPEAVHSLRLNPFDFMADITNEITGDSGSQIDEEIVAPEKPARVHQQQYDYQRLNKSLIQESSLIIPTPPRRSKQRTRSSLSPNVEIISSYGTYDRLI